jgi:dGTPase
VPDLYNKSDKQRIYSVANPDRSRSEFQRDYDRLIHSQAFRRLQGKMQLFPGYELDFFRNRMTHSLEVAQIARSIAERINSDRTNPLGNKINTDIVQAAALAHDLGHPPFGHTGEEALNECMARFGGFEGNAQTLRIVARLEKKDIHLRTNGPVIPPVVKRIDKRIGLNLTFRTLAAIVKYDHRIPRTLQGNAVRKGYYHTEADVVEQVKQHVIGKRYRELLNGALFRTIECQIMDFADDVAYATYDLEDAFKSGFMTPLDLLTAGDETYSAVARDIKQDAAVRRIDLPVSPSQITTSFVFKTIRDLVHIDEAFGNMRLENQLAKQMGSSDMRPEDVQRMLRSYGSAYARRVYRTAKRLAEDGYHRTLFTSEMIKRFIEGVTVKPNPTCPALSELVVDRRARADMEVLKRVTYALVTRSPRLRMVHFRGKQIVRGIFESLTAKGGCDLLPQDFRTLFTRFDGSRPMQTRVMCDFVAGMTDRYAVEFYGRLTSETPESIFKP